MHKSGELVLCCDAEASPEGAICLDVLYGHLSSDALGPLQR